MLAQFEKVERGRKSLNISVTFVPTGSPKAAQAKYVCVCVFVRVREHGGAIRNRELLFGITLNNDMNTELERSKYNSN